MAEKGNLGSRFLRQLNLIPPDKLPKTVTIIGVGGLGSHTAEKLARMGCQNLVLYDDDVVEEHNLGSQAFLNDAVGMKKVSAMVCKLLKVAECDVKQNDCKFDGNIENESVVICLPDKISTRSQIWEDDIMANPNVELYIEARMAGLFGYIYAFNPCDPEAMKEYESTLFEQDKAEEADCMARGVDFNCSGLADFIAAIVAAKSIGRKYPFELIIDFVNFRVIPRYLNE